MREIVLAIVLGALTGAAVAKLPPPTPQEQAKKEKEAADKKVQAERAKADLEHAQDALAQRYHARHPGTHASTQAAAEKLKDTDVASGAKTPDALHGK